MGHSIRFRRYGYPDQEALEYLNRWALQEMGTDPTDIPGHDDLADIPGTYFEAGGDFIVGIGDGQELSPERARALETEDGIVLAMGGYLPNEAGYADERRVDGAAELHRMRVAPPVQRRGFGRALLNALQRRAQAAGFLTLVATTAARQQPAVKFYSSNGFAEIERTSYHEYELVHFEKHLAPD